MFDWRATEDRFGEHFVDAGNAKVQRLQRVWRFFIVCGLTWTFNTCFLYHRGYFQGAFVCLVESAAYATIYLLAARVTKYHVVMHANLAMSAIGLTLVAVSDPALGATMLFFPVAIIVSAQLLGVSAAMVWTAINIVAFWIYFLASCEMDLALVSIRLDEPVLLTGVALCVFFCCQQAEVFYHLRTQGLIDLSNSLRKRGEELHALATTDSLTGLTNRYQFQLALRSSVNDDDPFALFLIDMDGFKEINDTLGHPAGDAALCEISRRLKRMFADRAMVSRLGGDEFCIIYPDVSSVSAATMIAEQVGDIVKERFRFEDTEFNLGTSVGFALYPEHSRSDRDLLAFADTAMFHAKENRLRFSSYDPAMTERLVEYCSLQEKLAKALEREEFFLVYQPQVDVETGEPFGVEALLRWRHDGEVISPMRFVHLLEQSHEIIPVSRWIIREACRQQAAWTALGLDICMSINVSAVQFGDQDLVPGIQSAIDEFGINPAKLDFEITEGVLIDNVELVQRKLQAIKDLGACISIDDFGTGYSSLAYLRQLSLDRLKVDRAFVKDYPEQDDGTLAGCVIMLAKSLGLRTIAEGIETDAQLAFLRSHGCDECQGYYFSRPVSADEVVRFFQANKQAELFSAAPS